MLACERSRTSSRTQLRKRPCTSSRFAHAGNQVRASTLTSACTQARTSTCLHSLAPPLHCTAARTCSLTLRRTHTYVDAHACVCDGHERYEIRCRRCTPLCSKLPIQALLNGEVITYAGDPLQDFQLGAFLDKVLSRVSTFCGPCDRVARFAIGSALLSELAGSSS
eukprot:5650378-Pleurochrysis_carterae.AAC.1